MENAVSQTLLKARLKGKTAHCVAIETGFESKTINGTAEGNLRARRSGQRQETGTGAELRFVRGYGCYMQELWGDRKGVPGGMAGPSGGATRRAWRRRPLRRRSAHGGRLSVIDVSATPCRRIFRCARAANESRETKRRSGKSPTHADPDAGGDDIAAQLLPSLDVGPANRRSGTDVPNVGILERRPATNASRGRRTRLRRGCAGARAS